MSQLTDAEKIVRDAISDWNGWPAPDWVVTHVMRKYHFAEETVQNAVRGLINKRVAVVLEHKGQHVLRLE